VADLDEGASQPGLGDAGDGGEPVTGYHHGGVGRLSGAADLPPELGERDAVQVGEPGDVGGGGFVVGGRDRDR
jgi:hypothetical protein